MPASPLAVSRQQILAFRRATNHLSARLPPGRRSLRKAAWVGLQDSMPRAAVLSVNARVEQTRASAWEDPAYVQVWGPRYSVYVVPARDVAVFTLGRLPDEPKARKRAYDLASALDQAVGGAAMPFGEAARLLGGGDPNRLRYATTTGTVLLRWDGARQPAIRTVPAPAVAPADARRELARRYLHAFGPATPASFAAWAGVKTPSALETFDRLRRSLTAVATPTGEAWVLSRDVDTLQTAAGRDSTVRLLPSGDAYYLLHGEGRALLVPDPAKRAQLWTSRVWPGAILAGGEIVGTWRRAKNKVTAHPWSRLSRRVREAVEAEAAALPLPEPDGQPTLEWVD